MLINPQIESISPDIGLQGQYLDVNISGSGAQFTDYSESNMQFRFSQYSETIYGVGNISNSGNNYISGSVQIPTNTNLGIYNLEVFDYSINNWIVLEDAFEVFPTIEIQSVNPQVLTEGETSTVLIYVSDINPNSIILRKMEILFKLIIDFIQKVYFNTRF